MYIPKTFREEDVAKLQELMQNNNFAILVTQQEGVPQVSHLPFVLDTTRGAYGTLLSHMARANPQWRAFEERREALVVFQGPHAYISPSWYENPVSVPTWNFAAVHTYGKPRIITDKREMYNLMAALVQQFEARFEKPWQFDLPDEFVQNRLEAVVCFEMEIVRLEGKFKLSQNRPVSDQRRVAAILKKSNDALSAGVAALMEQLQGSE